MSSYNNLEIGSVYNNWTILRNLGRNKHGKFSYECQCKCGSISNVEGGALVKGRSKSCGCLKRVSKQEQKERRKKYKADYFQENKEKIYERNKQNKPSAERIKQYYVKSKYKISIEDVDKLLKLQDGKCAICGVEFNDNVRANKMVIDHNHITGEVRGLLCHNCNVGLGHFKDNVELLAKAINYLGGDNIEKISNSTRD